MTESKDDENRDLMISYSHSDSSEIAEMLFEELTGYGLDVWYDEVDISIGDRISNSIDRGLQTSNHAVVIVSPSYFEGMSDLELGGLFKKQSRSDGKVILPVLYEISFEELEQQSWSLSDLHGVEISKDNVQEVASKVFQSIKDASEEQEVNLEDAPSNHFAEVQASFKDLADIEKGDKVRIDRWRSKDHPRNTTITVVEMTVLKNSQEYSGSNFVGTTQVQKIPLEGYISDISNKTTGSTDFELRIPRDEYDELPDDRDAYKSVF
ncbi:TIR protein [Halorhabdus utahensis DSM 12940]|uniref:TIR protein n=1 Tax=Halorhabdus utahensis (strain DSM 12940 / JCM 11049 / AX-2) TaxID=519442 RepID=C7NU92_HALUD|nr:toll/interleukin-1 receptor domain-containing protein [Halorhabdus utahensis]ACV10989.1 TIR protein [Halorhabdus utahensis DSM 12940]